MVKQMYHNKEFVVEDVDGGWLGFGMKEDVFSFSQKDSPMKRGK